MTVNGYTWLKMAQHGFKLLEMAGHNVKWQTKRLLEMTVNV